MYTWKKSLLFEKSVQSKRIFSYFTKKKNIKPSFSRKIIFFLKYTFLCRKVVLFCRRGWMITMTLASFLSEILASLKSRDFLALNSIKQDFNAWNFEERNFHALLNPLSDWNSLFCFSFILFSTFVKHELQNKKRLTNALEPINVMKLIIIQNEHVSLCSVFHAEVSQGTS